MGDNREGFEKNLEEYKQMLESSKPELGMKWFKYLIYFQLFYSAVNDLARALSLIFNFQNEFIQKLFDLKYYDSDLRTVGVLFGFIFFIFAAVSVYIRFELAGFKKRAPKKFMIFIAATQVLACANEIIVNLSGPYPADTRRIVGTVLTLVFGYAFGYYVFIYPNIVYFKKRAHLFIN